jgi:hypothetical protein
LPPRWISNVSLTIRHSADGALYLQRKRVPKTPFRCYSGVVLRTGAERAGGRGTLRRAAVVQTLEGVTVSRKRPRPRIRADRQCHAVRCV